MSKETLSVEVFRDSDTPRTSLFDAEMSLARISRLVGGFSIIDMTRLIGVTTNSFGRADVDRVTWSNMQADLNIVITDKPMVDEDHEIILGTTYGNGTQTYPRVAVVDNLQADVKDTLSHEIGHMIELGHCGAKSCLMYQTSVERLEQVFCHSCKRKLGQNALRIAGRRAKLTT